MLGSTARPLAYDTAFTRYWYTLFGSMLGAAADPSLEQHLHALLVDDGWHHAGQQRVTPHLRYHFHVLLAIIGTEHVWLYCLISAYHTMSTFQRWALVGNVLGSGA